MTEPAYSRLQELRQELQSVLTGRPGILDASLPPLIFLLINAVLGLNWAIWSALGSAVLLAAFRLVRRQPLRYALGGLGGVLLAVLLAFLLGGAEGFFLPRLLSGSLTVVLCLSSVIARRPLVAWTSALARRWPLDWYWHPKIRPAYSEVTLAWAVFFGLRLFIQYRLYQQGAGQTLGWVQLLTDWPATLVLLILSYLYGLWRLAQLQGPSVAEFKSGSLPPWEGQKRGF